ncbi:MAG TPA: nickel transporter [Rhodocyclaceae bacterium]
METLPTDFLAVLALVFLWGARHGFDADHLATIDGLTRYNARQRPAFARHCGVLFSLGHGAVVVVVAVAVSALAANWQVPAWLAHLGVWISIVFLIALAFLNLRAVMTTPRHELVSPAGIRTRLLGRFQRSGSPLMIAGVGALFALSFDTLSQAALFALTAQQFGGWGHGLALGLAFLLGMLICDGLNGLWIARLLRQADRRAAIASRVMGVAIAAMALLVAGFGLAKYLSPAIDAWAEDAGMLTGLVVVATILLSFFVALRLSLGVAARTARAAG